jgi:phospholipase C
MSNPQNPIEHIVLLMLENRSFDHLLGNLHPQSPTFEGVNDRMCNVYEATGKTYYVSNNSSGDDPYLTPSAVPGEAFADINLQIFNATDPCRTAAPNMAGFINDWMAGTVTKYPGIPGGKECLLPWSPPWPQLPRAKNLAPGDIMFYFNTSGPNPQLPVTSYLARSYGISDAWFGSCPTQTIANRMFLHCATSGGYVDNPSYFDKLFPLPFPKLPSIFELLDGGNGPNCANWKVYFHDYPVSGMVDYVFQASGLDIFRRTPSPPVVCSFDEHDFGHLTRRPTFAEDIRNRTLPKYSCIEPRYGVRFPTNPPHPNPASNSNHPPDNMLYGEILQATVYNLLRSSEYYWPRTLLIITYDEHGGFFDHVIPPAAVPPGGIELPHPDWPGGFDRFGPRVPTIFVSPYMPAGSNIRPPGFSYIQNDGTSTTNGVTPFDHTSIIRTIIDCFHLQPESLTRRDAAAPGLLGALDFSQNPNESPGTIAPPDPPSAHHEPTAPHHHKHFAEMYEAIMHRIHSSRSKE